MDFIGGLYLQTHVFQSLKTAMRLLLQCQTQCELMVEFGVGGFLS